MIMSFSSFCQQMFLNFKENNEQMWTLNSVKYFDLGSQHFFEWRICPVSQYNKSNELKRFVVLGY